MKLVITNTSIGPIVVDAKAYTKKGDDASPEAILGPGESRAFEFEVPAATVTPESGEAPVSIRVINSGKNPIRLREAGEDFAFGATVLEPGDVGALQAPHEIAIEEAVPSKPPVGG